MVQVWVMLDQYMLFCRDLAIDITCPASQDKLEGVASLE